MGKTYWKWIDALDEPGITEDEMAERVLAGEDADDYFCDDEFDEGGEG